MQIYLYIFLVAVLTGVGLYFHIPGKQFKVMRRITEDGSVILKPALHGIFVSLSILGFCGLVVGIYCLLGTPVWVLEFLEGRTFRLCYGLITMSIGSMTKTIMQFFSPMSPDSVWIRGIEFVCGMASAAGIHLLIAKTLI